MTAEIAILNRMGVALAADSAVTVADEGSGESVKTYNTANKLFSLSKFHPVGVMVYGSADLMGVPWETIIKFYRGQLADRVYDSLDEYATDFLRFVEHHASRFFPEDQQARYVDRIIRSQMARVADDAGSAIRDAYESGDQPSDEDVRSIIVGSLEALIARRRQLPVVDDCDESFAKAVVSRYDARIRELVSTTLGQQHLTEQAFSLFGELVGESIVRADYEPGQAGVVIAGFGRNDLFPSLRCYLFSGYVLDRLIVRRDENRAVDISFDNQATVMPFAQDDMACVFMEGIDRDYHRFIRSTLGESFSRLPSLIAGALSTYLADQRDEVAAVLDKMIADALSTVDERSVEYMDSYHVRPIVTTVGMLSKDELAVMAETLVNLTAFKRRMTMVPETVGGPVDVAVISRGDGFVWLKRKHYFDGNLNHQFFRNYFRREED